MSCKNEVSEEELVKYINDPENGLTHVKEINKVQYEIIYKPTSLIVLQDQSSMTMSDSVKKENEQNYEKYFYFTLTLSAAGKDVLYGTGTIQSFSENIQMFSFGMNELIKMTTDTGDTIALADYYMPNLYGMAKSTQILLAFERPKKEIKELKINIEELGFGTGKQQFLFRKKDIEAIPDLIQNKI